MDRALLKIILSDLSSRIPILHTDFPYLLVLDLKEKVLESDGAFLRCLLPDTAVLYSELQTLP
jgi:hypothetical protein